MYLFYARNCLIAVRTPRLAVRCCYLHHVREGLPLPGRLQGSLGSHQVEQLHLVAATGRQLDEEPLEDALGLVAERRAQQAHAGRGFLTQLPQQLTAAPRKHQGGKKNTMTTGHT